MNKKRIILLAVSISLIGLIVVLITVPNWTDKKAKSLKASEPVTEVILTDAVPLESTPQESVTQEVKKAKTSTTGTTKNIAQKTSQVEETTSPLKQYSKINEIVDFYNSSINNVKTKSKNATKNYEEMLTIESNLTNGEVTSTLISSYFNKGRNSSPVVYTSYNDKVAGFPVAGQSFSSKLQANMVKSASCTYKNGFYNIVINLRSDTAGQNYSSTCLSVVSEQWVSDTCNNIIDKSEISLSCKNCIIRCKIDSSTGNVVSLNTYMPTVVNLTAFKENQSFTFYIKQDWSISW